MLAVLGLSSLDELFAVVPEAVKLQRDLELADGVGAAAGAALLTGAVAGASAAPIAAVWAFAVASC